MCHDQVFMLTARGKITKKGIVKFKVKLEYSVKGEKHSKNERCALLLHRRLARSKWRYFTSYLQFDMKNLWSLATGGEGSDRVALNSSI